MGRSDYSLYLPFDRSIDLILAGSNLARGRTIRLVNEGNNSATVYVPEGIKIQSYHTREVSIETAIALESGYQTVGIGEIAEAADWVGANILHDTGTRCLAKVVWDACPQLCTGAKSPYAFGSSLFDWWLRPKCSHSTPELLRQFIQEYNLPPTVTLAKNACDRVDLLAPIEGCNEIRDDGRAT